MKEIIQIINQLRAISSTKEKENILRNNKDNELLQKVLYYTYNDDLKYKFSEKILDSLSSIDYKTNSHVGHDTIFDLLEVLSNSNICDELRGLVKEFLISANSDEERALYKCMILKDLRGNISSKTIEKVWKGLLPKWDVQQAYPMDKVKLKKNEWISLSLKLNGIRSTYKDDEFKSRQNKPMLGLNHVAEDLKKIAWLEGYVVDGEMVRKNVNNIPDNENFRLTTSIMNSDDNDKSEIQFVIFDLIPREEFIKGESKKGFKDRLEDLQRLRRDINDLELGNITVAPTYYVGTDHSMIEPILATVDRLGYEGLMLLRDMPYKTKRHNGILKCKKFKSSDCRITGYEEGTGRLKGLLGSFIIDYKGNKVNVGSGYSDEQRKVYWDNRDEYMGRILEVKFKEESKDSKTGLISLQFPTFVCIREQGKEVSYN